MGDPLDTAAEVVRTDLDAICDALTAELEQLAGTRLWVVGGAGFLGYYLVQAALHYNRTRAPSASVTVSVLDGYLRGKPSWLAGLEGDPNLELIEHDIRQPLSDAYADPDWIFHAASIASPTYYRRDPIGTMDANVGGLRTLLDRARAQAERGHPVRGIVFFSSSEIYGDPTPEHIPTPEDYRGYVSCTGPRACYDEAKRYGETLCVNFAHQHGVPVKIARPFNNIGPGLKITDRRVLPDFARNILAGEDIVMLSDGGPKRTFCYVADAVVGYYKVLVRGRPGEPYNVGVESPEISVHDLATRLVEIAGELFGYGGRIVRQTASSDADYLVDNPARRCPVIHKARQELGYEPRMPLDEALRRCLLWYRDNPVSEEA